MRGTRRLAILLVALALLSAACSDDDDQDVDAGSADETAEADAVDCGTFELRLRQQGAVVAGDFTAPPLQSTTAVSDRIGSVSGDVSGDLLRLRNSNGRWQFELTVAHDEMTGIADSPYGTRAAITFRRAR